MLRFFVTLLVVGLAATASATVPLRMPIQGVLRDGTGMPAPDGAYEVSFALYDGAAGGDPLWTETWSSAGPSCGTDPTGCVEVAHGAFHALLGEHTDIPSTLFAEHPELWLGVSVEGEPELTPRRPLASVPFAFHAASAGEAAALACSGCLQADALSPGAIDAIRTEAVAAGAEAGFIKADDPEFNWAASDEPGGAALVAQTASTLDGHAVNADGTPQPGTVPVTGTDGKIPESLLPFDKGDLLAPEDRLLVAGLDAVKSDYFRVVGLGIEGGVAKNVKKGVTFGPGDALEGELNPGFDYPGIGEDGDGNPSSAGFWPQTLHWDSPTGSAMTSLDLTIPIASSPVYRWSAGCDGPGLGLVFDLQGQQTWFETHSSPDKTGWTGVGFPQHPVVGLQTVTFGCTSTSHATTGTGVLASVLYGHLVRAEPDEDFVDELRYAVGGGTPTPSDWESLTNYGGSLLPLHDGEAATAVTMPATLERYHLIYRVALSSGTPTDSIRVVALLSDSGGYWSSANLRIWDPALGGWANPKGPPVASGPDSKVESAVDLDAAKFLMGDAVYLLVETTIDPSWGTKTAVGLHTLDFYFGNKNPFPQPLPNDLCDNAEPLDMTTAKVLSDQSTTDDGVGELRAWDDYGDTCGGAGGRDVVYAIQVAERSVIKASVLSKFESVLYLRTSCDGQTVACDLASISTEPLDPGTYSLFVDGATQAAAGDFTLLIERIPAPLPANDLCANATAVDGQKGATTTVSEPSVFATNAVDACSSTGQGEVAYSLLLTTPSTLKVDVSANFDPVIYLKTGQCDGAPLPLCFGGSFSQSLAPGAYTLFIDGMTPGVAQSFDMTISVE